jgi:SpoVK/Ycf46/Vps4 family AAA+-type ATPase
MHPALAALHSLLLPPLLFPQAFQHLQIDTPKGELLGRRSVKRCMHMCVHADSFARSFSSSPPPGLLLSGPPGVGKTYSVGSVCRSLGVELFLLDGASIFGVGVAGAAEEALRDKFRQAQECARPAVLFIDEIDVLCPHRTNEAAQLSNRLVAQLLSLMDGLENRGHLLIVGATNQSE